MGILSDLSKLGLGKFENEKIISEPVKREEDLGEKKAVKTIEEPEVLFDKHYTCPVCDKKFAVKAVRAGKLRKMGHDTDLRPIYEFVDPLKYDVISCPVCGYSALGRYFGSLSSRQMKDLKEQVGSHFAGLDETGEIYSYDDAILRHKLAIVCSMVKNAKNSERGYTCLKLAWVIRGKRLSLGASHDAYAALYKEELEVLANAYEGLYKSISTEAFPIAGMDESTIKYILADVARKQKNYEEAGKLLSYVITSRSTKKLLKEEALKLKEVIKQELKGTK